MSAMQMMMVCHVWIETLGASEYFDDIHDADVCEGQKRAVDRIEGDAGYLLLHDPVDILHREVFPLHHDSAEYGQTLRCDTEVVPSAGFDEWFDQMLRCFFHVTIIKEKLLFVK